LDGSEIQIYAQGEYPTRAKTKVQNVAVYQNDGTETIEASHFVERAVEKHDGWQNMIFKRVAEFLEMNGTWTPVLIAGRYAAVDVRHMCDRIDTGRLQRSFTALIKKGGRVIAG
jgi:hypothetical protein